MEMKTNYFEIETEKGNIWCAYDYKESSNEKNPLVIIAPGYEKTARESLSIASYLVLNNFRVLRFDARNCCGLSSGNLDNFTLTSLAEDIKYIVDYSLNHLSSGNPISILAISLSARSMLRYLSENPNIKDKIKVAVSIVGVVDVQHTIVQITKKNYFAGYLEGEKYGKMKLLTYEIDYDNFIKDTYKNNFLTYESSINEAKNINISYYGSIITSDDEWILRDHQIHVHNAFKNTHVEQFMIEGASHKIWKNPRSAEIAIKNCTRIISKYLLKKDISEKDILKPEITNIIIKNKAERKIIFEWDNNNLNKVST